MPSFRVELVHCSQFLQVIPRVVGHDHEQLRNLTN